jgi:hypothetical protein
MIIQFNESVLLALEQQRQSASALVKRERYLALLNPLPDEHILDLGCGGGGFCRALAPAAASNSLNASGPTWLVQLAVANSPPKATQRMASAFRAPPTNSSYHFSDTASACLGVVILYSTMHSPCK